MKRLSSVCIVVNILFITFILFNTTRLVNDSQMSKKDTFVHVYKINNMQNRQPAQKIDVSQIIKHTPGLHTNCKALLNGDTKAQKTAMIFMQTQTKREPQTDQKLFQLDCPIFMKRRGYIVQPTNEEKKFPVAYSLVNFNDFAQFERLFHAIYRPQNSYCLHVDEQSSLEFKTGIDRLVKCFPNFITSSRSVNVKRGTWSALEADLICMKDLLDRFPDWKYLINLSPQDFPMRTNLELVKHLKALNGSNSIVGSLAKTIYNPEIIPMDNPEFEVRDA